MKKIRANSCRITLNLPKNLVFDLMMMAHERDITLNELVNEILSEYIEAKKNENYQ